jgi:hypothetical protein
VYLGVPVLSGCRFSDCTVPSRFQWKRRAGRPTTEVGTVLIPITENIRGIQCSGAHNKSDDC